MRIRFFSRILLLFSAAASIASCSVYQSDGSKALEKNSGQIVIGFNLELSVKYECVRLMAMPSSWKTQVISLKEFSTVDFITASLDNTREFPTVLVSTSADQTFEGCALEILDSKSSSQRLKDVVEYGEDLLLLGR